MFTMILIQPRDNKFAQRLIIYLLKSYGITLRQEQVTMIVMPFIIMENPQEEKIPGGVWYPGTEARTSWMPATIYPNPFATKFDSTATGTFPSVIGETGLGQTTYFEQEVGNNQINPNGSSTAIAAELESFDLDLEMQGAGQFYLSISRFMPDFKVFNRECRRYINR